MRQRFRLEDGAELSYEITEHAQPVVPGLVVLVHGRLHTATRGPCAALRDHLKCSTLTFDARGMGESSGETGWNNVQEEIDDLKHLLSHVRTSNSAPLNRIAAIIGHSKGAVVVLSLASDASFLSALNGASSPPPLIISLSARYDTSSLSPSGLSRFNDEQKAALERDGRFVWLRYRAGPEPERPERREYVVTKEAVESAKRRTLECVESIPRGTQVLLLHGRADGTVPTIETGKVDARIRDHGEASSDVVLVEGVEHNWDGEGELEAAAEWIEVWMKARTKRPANRVLEADLVDHLGLNRRK